uniref:Uncharacterized protein n=1 Tax=Anguilla anguilla TaxID=7936 RepID=A0A0E9RQV5_ANGAN
MKFHWSSMSLKIKNRIYACQQMYIFISYFTFFSRTA